MTRSARLAALEAVYPITDGMRRLDMSILTNAELEVLTSLPRDEQALSALMNAPDYDWMPVARIIERLEQAADTPSAYYRAIPTQINSFRSTAVPSPTATPTATNPETLNG